MNEKNQWLRQQLLLSVPAFTHSNYVTVALHSWNVDQIAPPDNLETWVCTPNITRAVEQNIPVPAAPIEGAGQAPITEWADVVCIGLQELDMSSQALVRGKTEKKEPWMAALKDALDASHSKDPGDASRYCELASSQLVGLMFAVYVKRSLLPHIDTPVGGGMESAATGAIGGSLGNKGGLVYSFRIHGASFCVVNLHLAAHQNAVEKRNKNAESVFEKKLHSPLPGVPLEKTLVGVDGTGSSKGARHPGPAHPMDHDFVLVLGDLNYRIDDIDNDSVRRMSKTGQFSTLMEHDQLKKQLMNKDTFWGRNGFKAAEPKFPPTYRYDAGKSSYDTSEKCRTPAWTDRILWYANGYSDRDPERFRLDVNGRVGIEDPVELLWFRRLPHLLDSDHRPIAGLLRCKIYTLDPTTRDIHRDNLIKSYERQGEVKPAIEVSRNNIDFGILELGQAKTVDVEVRNTGNHTVQCKVCGETFYPRSLYGEPDGIINAIKKERTEAKLKREQALAPGTVPGSAEHDPVVDVNEEVRTEVIKGLEKGGYRYRWIKATPNHTSIAEGQSRTITITACIGHAEMEAICEESRLLGLEGAIRGTELKSRLQKAGLGRAGPNDSHHVTPTPVPSTIALDFNLTIDTVGSSMGQGCNAMSSGFITLSGKFRPSCISSSLQWLTRCSSHPIAEVCGAAAPRHGGKDTQRALYIPKELWILVDYLSDAGVKAFTQEGADDGVLLGSCHDESEVERVRYELDHKVERLDQAAPPLLPSAVAITLLRFLRLSHQPVVTYRHYYPALYSVLDRQELPKNPTPPKTPEEVAHDFPPAHYNAFCYITSFITHWLARAKGSSKKRVLRGFADAMLRKPPVDVKVGEWVDCDQESLSEQQERELRVAFLGNFVRC